MNVILLESVNNLGDLGDEVSVKSGFARNFLLPKKKAVQANDANRAVFEERKKELDQKELFQVRKNGLTLGRWQKKQNGRKNNLN